MKHTPGPWVVDEFYAPGGFWKIRAEDDVICHVHAMSARLGPTKTSEADARLIAAAPELLAALKAIREHAWGGEAQKAEAIRRVDAAIAKAEAR